MRQKTNFEKVCEFNNAMGVEVGTGASKRLGFRLVEEEYLEWQYEDPGTPGDLKELCDILYVVYGYAHRCGYDLDTAFNRVHESNMSKLGEDGKPIYREDGKVMKGPNYKPPYLGDLC